MKSIKSLVCSKANQIIKNGYSKSEAFTKAWVLVKAEAVQDKMHVLKLSSDCFSSSERAAYNKLSSEYGILMNRASSIKIADEIDQRAKADRRLAEISERLSDIQFAVSIHNKKSTSDERAAYITERKELEAEQKRIWITGKVA